jgi:long-chain-fatty-acid---luciferin-component ligase
MELMNQVEGKLWQNTIELFYRPSEKWTAVDQLIYGLEDYFDYSPEEIQSFQVDAVKESFQHHFHNNLFYNHYCKENNITPEDIIEKNDFSRIPMVPDRFFKDYPTDKPQDVYEWLYRVSSVDIGDFSFSGSSLQDFLRWAEERLNGIVTHSSGTTGHFSIMFRDRLTYQRMFYAAVKTLLFSIVHPNEDAHFVYPGPVRTYLTMGHWISEGTQVFDDSHRHFLTERELTMDIVKLMAGQVSGVRDKMKLALLRKVMQKGQYNLIKLLQKLDNKSKQVMMITFPFQLYDLMKIMREKNITLSLGDQDSVIITGGGWKIYEGKKVSPGAFAEMIEETLGVPADHYKDIYGMSEMNALGMDCDHRYKHLHPWLYPMVLDNDNQPLPFGSEGRFAFLDPASNSYPGFIITGDKVKLFDRCPACNKPGMVLDSNISRMMGAEAKGCGNLMRGLIAHELKG